MKISKLVAALVTVCLLAGCEQNNAPGASTSNGGGINKQGMTSGTPVNAAPAISPSRAVTPAGGALLGNALSTGLGRSMDNADRAAYDAASQHALETGQPGETMPWKNPQSGNSGTVTPQNYYQNSTGQYCREYSQTLVVGGQKQDGTGKACRQLDASWQLVQ